MAVDLETVLAVIISLIALNLLFIGFYIISVLRDLKRTVNKAESVIGEVDRTVKDGIEKAQAMERPLRALATATAAVTGMVRGAGAIKKATQSIMSGGDSQKNSEDAPDPKPSKKSFLKRPKFFKK